MTTEYPPWYWCGFFFLCGLLFERYTSNGNGAGYEIGLAIGSWLRGVFVGG
jgi:hypothetical protein